MEKKYQVFVSSTFQDLIEERQEVMQALLELDCMPAGMELFPAANEDQWSLIRKVIDDCDYYIVIIGGRYGTVDPKKGISYTQMEYEYAIAQSIPTIAFLHEDPSQLIAAKTEKDPINQKKLEDFRALAQKKMVKHWSSPSDLGSVVSRSIVKLIKSEPGVGWVKASFLPDKALTEENLQLRKEVEVLRKRIESIRISAPEGTEDLAKDKDEIELQFSFQGYDSDTYKYYGYNATIKVSWSDIFNRISPLMINEASETTLRSSLDELIKAKSIQSVLQKNPDLKKYARIENFHLNGDDFNTIKVQLLALNMIKKSEKTRSLTDKAAYWTLTPYGESEMFKLRAKQRPTII